jgi:heme exporter protein C
MATSVTPQLIEPPSAGRWPLFGVFAVLFFAAMNIFAVVTSPPERDMGDLQKIMYVHIPVAWNAFIAFFIAAIAFLRVLWKRSERADLLGLAAAEVGTVLTGLTLVLGMLWAKPTWGVWWAWEPRLTSTLVLFLIFCGYLALRSFVDDPDRRAQWSAAVGLLGAINVPIVYMSVRWWRTLHQIQSTPETIDSPYKLGMRLNAFAVLFLVIYFIRRRYEAALTERAAEYRAQAIALGEPARG